MIGREQSSRTYPQLGVSEAHHPISHHLNDPGKLTSLAKINTHHVNQHRKGRAPLGRVTGPARNA
jgi:hypothetical protein